MGSSRSIFHQWVSIFAVLITTSSSKLRSMSYCKALLASTRDLSAAARLLGLTRAQLAYRIDNARRSSNGILARVLNRLACKSGSKHCETEQLVVS
ncbi:helix-turn-helix domain-containing protein [Rhizobium sp. No.120]